MDQFSYIEFNPLRSPHKEYPKHKAEQEKAEAQKETAAPADGQTETAPAE